MPTPCFWVEETDREAWGLRRFVSSTEEKCPAGGYHNALKMIGERKRPPSRLASRDLDDFPAAIRRRKDWPTACDACGREFVDGDYFQVWTEKVFRRPETGEEWNGRDLPAGAIYDLAWMHHLDAYRVIDGICLGVVLPPGPNPPPIWDARTRVWTADGPASTGGYWTRTGDPRNPPSLSYTPSIAFGVPGSQGYYHGFLTAGALTDHVG